MSRTRGEDVFEIALKEMMSEGEMSRQLATFAAEQIAIAAAQNRKVLGRDSPYSVTVDGVPGKSLTAVRPNGEIVADFDVLGDTLEWIAAALRDASPMLTGQFRSSNILLADDVEVPSGAAAPFADEYVFINTQPYARKIERGLSSQAPAGVFQVVAALASRRVGNIASVSYGFRSLLGVSSLDNWAQKTSLTKQPRRTFTAADRDEWLRRQPAIIVRPR